MFYKKFELLYFIYPYLRSWTKVPLVLLETVKEVFKKDHTNFSENIAHEKHCLEKPAKFKTLVFLYTILSVIVLLLRRWIECKNRIMNGIIGRRLRDSVGSNFLWG